MTVKKLELDSIQLDSIWDYPFVIALALTNSRCLGGKRMAHLSLANTVYLRGEGMSNLL